MFVEFAWSPKDLDLFPITSCGGSVESGTVKRPGRGAANAENKPVLGNFDELAVVLDSVET